MSTSILLQGGTVLVHDAGDHVTAIKADLLIEGNTISKIEASIEVSAETKIIDCTDKILSPGFVDTHHHVWQTLLKGRHGNDLLLDYMPHGNMTSGLHTPEDIFWGQLGGCLEMLDAGTTTVVDHFHANYSPDHSKAALAASIPSGIRSIFCYTPTAILESWSPLKFSENMFADWVMGTFAELATQSPFGDGRVQLGLGFDALFLPKEMVVGIFEQVKALGVKLITLHYARVPSLPFPSPFEVLDSYDLLDSSILVSHASNATATDAALVAKSHCHIATTPSTELSMAMGEPAAFHSSLDLQSQCGVGVDCHSNSTASIVNEVRLLLASSRTNYSQEFVTQGKVPTKTNHTTEEAFNLATVGGARAAGMEGKVGTLKAGAFADILVWDALSPSMVCGAQHDPVSTIILNSSPQDIEMVIVDGVVRKEGGKLKSVDIKTGRAMWSGVEQNTLEWKDVGRELVRRREVLQKKVEGIDFEEVRKGMVGAFYIDESKIVESV